MLFAYFLADNRSIVINRGNHEDEHWNSRDKKKGARMYDKFVRAMKVFPLCTVLQNGRLEEKEKKVFVVHGGLATAADTPNWSLTIDFIKSIDHTEFTQPDTKSHVLQDIVWNDLLWSDPCDDKTFKGSKPQ